jgi:hypothetical protein
MDKPRKRASLACNYCRRRWVSLLLNRFLYWCTTRKRRCNGVFPSCGLCEDSGIECVYNEVDSSRWGAHFNAMTSLILTGLEERVPPLSSSDVSIQLRTFYGATQGFPQLLKRVKPEMGDFHSHRRPQNMKGRTFPSLQLCWFLLRQGPIQRMFLSLLVLIRRHSCRPSTISHPWAFLLATPPQQNICYIWAKWRHSSENFRQTCLYAPSQEDICLTNYPLSRAQLMRINYLYSMEPAPIHWWRHTSNMFMLKCQSLKKTNSWLCMITMLDRD